MYKLTLNNYSFDSAYTLDEIMAYLKYKEKQKYPIKTAIIWDSNTGEVIAEIKKTREE